MDICLHGALWRTVSTQRAEEWRRVLDELAQMNRIEPTVPGPEAASLELLQTPDGQWQFRLLMDGVRRGATCSLDSGLFDTHLNEYRMIIERLALMDREAPVRGFEALDYAKRVVHDDAAATLMDALRDLVRMELSDARSLFTLFFLASTDLPEALVRYHRYHRS
jgi:uncharacterized protein (UPF0262 family)